jgi:hypothetical protein
MVDAPMPPEMTPVESSNLAAVGHDGTALWIKFKDSTNKKGEVRPGGTYRYPTASAALHAGLLSAPSAGQYFHQQIKPAHQGERVG